MRQRGRVFIINRFRCSVKNEDLTLMFFSLTCKKVFDAGKALKRKAGIVGHALSKLIEKEDDPFEYAVPIPDEVLNDQNWPVDREITTAIIIQKKSEPSWVQNH